MIQILPSILTADPQEYATKIEKIEESGAFEEGFIHVDFADNEFVPNQTVDLAVLKKFPTKLAIEAHLMVQHPKDWIVELIATGVKRIIIHVETLGDDGLDFLQSMKKDGLQIGLAINLETPVAKLEPFMDTIDVVLVMAIHPGFSGQEFITESKEKIKEIVRVRAASHFGFRIEVDGGITVPLVTELSNIGVDRVIMASHLVEGDIDENLEKIWEYYKENSESA